MWKGTSKLLCDSGGWRIDLQYINTDHTKDQLWIPGCKKGKNFFVSSDLTAMPQNDVLDTPHIRPLEIILAKKTTELVLLFHKETIKLVFFWPNIGQKSFKVLIYST